LGISENTLYNIFIVIFAVVLLILIIKKKLKWFFIGLGALMLVLALVSDFFYDPDTATYIGIGSIVLGLLMTWFARRRARKKEGYYGVGGYGNGGKKGFFGRKEKDPKPRRNWSGTRQNAWDTARNAKEKAWNLGKTLKERSSDEYLAKNAQAKYEKKLRKEQARQALKESYGKDAKKDFAEAHAKEQAKKQAAQAIKQEISNLKYMRNELRTAFSMAVNPTDRKNVNQQLKNVKSQIKDLEKDLSSL